MLTEDVKRVLERTIKPDDPDAGDSVSLVAEKASTSTRTVYRILGLDNPTLSLDLADRLCLAADGHLSDCRLKNEDGTIVDY